MILVFYSEIWIAKVPHKSHECHSFRLLVIQIQAQLFFRIPIKHPRPKIGSSKTGDDSVLGLGALILLLFLIGPPKTQIQPKLQAQISGMPFTQGRKFGRAESRRLMTSVTSSAFVHAYFVVIFHRSTQTSTVNPNWRHHITSDWASYLSYSFRPISFNRLFF